MRNSRLATGILQSVVFLGLLLAGTFSMAQDQFIRYLPGMADEQLDMSQMRYLQTVRSWAGTVQTWFVLLNAPLLDHDELIMHYRGTDFTVRRGAFRPQSYSGSWIGKVENLGSDVHLVRKGDMVVGLVELGGEAFLIRPLGKGLHVVVQWDMTIDDGCQTDNNLWLEESESALPQHRDLDRRIASGNSWRSTGSLTGECNVRVLVAYTPQANAALPDVLLDIYNLINIANTGYAHSLQGGPAIDMSIELAGAMEVDYTQSGNLTADLYALTFTNDGKMDEVHTFRSLWDADQVALICTGGGGVAWQNLTYSRQFSVTGVANFGVFTFHHELGHNALCTHALTQASSPGIAPYAGFGDPSGCYRTVLAYADACGTYPCSRQNIFSDDDPGGWTCGGTDYTPGTSNTRNQDRLDFSGPVIIDYRTVPLYSEFTQDYTIRDKESTHLAAGDTLVYMATDTSNHFEWLSGSEGSFRAAKLVRLGPGFHAQSGSNFRAWIDNGCTPFELTASVDGYEPKWNKRSIHAEDQEYLSWQLTATPNPAADRVRISFQLPSDQAINLYLLDSNGSVVSSIMPRTHYAAGNHNKNVSLSSLPVGTYRVILQSEGGLRASTTLLVVR